jgi:tRNA(Ile)-lysidine synthase
MILEAVKRTIARHDLLKKNDKVLLAYSGGVDSTGMLAVFLELREPCALDLFLGHFNHRLRSGADQDEQFVRKVARDNSLPLFVASEDVRSFAQQNRMNLEEAGRVLRYEFLTRTAQKIGGAKIATGHTLNDQAETFFLRLMRGSGLKGLGSIYPAVEGQIIRPLLDVERKDIEEFVRRKGLSYRDDESNLDRQFRRNKVRLDLIPFIQENFEPEIIRRIGKTVSILQEEDYLLEKLSRHSAEENICRENEDILLDIESLMTLPRGLARRIVRQFIHGLKGDLREITFDDVESVLNLEEGESFPLTAELLLIREDGRVFNKPKLPRKIPYAYDWDGSSPLVLEELNLVIKSEKIRRPRSFEFDDEARAYLDEENVRFPLRIRNRLDGDRYQPLGAPGHKKLKEIMRAKSIPIQERDKRPVFLSCDEIVWILGLPVAEKYRVREKTKNVVMLTVSPLGQR